MPRPAPLHARQLWDQMTTSTKRATASAAECTPFELPAGGAIVFNESYTSILTDKLIFQQPCDNSGNSEPGMTGNSTVVGLKDPFYASTSPQIYAIAAATVISFVLVILIFITPRTFFVGGPGDGTRFRSRRGMIGGSYGSSSAMGVGRRPWLQKIATVTVAISLTIATADTFTVAADQYYKGYMDASLLVSKVVGSLEIKIVRVISETFLWLAQVQTLIRLFPRHKEKVTIKWVGFALVMLDTVFTVLDYFVSQGGQTRPRHFQDAIPAVSYLFELAIGLIYASCVIYYSFSKRRYAFWHPKMRNICLVALLSLIAVLIPVVFFIVDVCKPYVAGWGDYIRWVGAAAASVVVWEWVERIEALERDEKKDGILGREIFDGDEMLDVTPAEEADWPGRRQYWNQHGFPTDDPDAEHATPRRRQRSRVKPHLPFGRRQPKITAGTAQEEPQTHARDLNTIPTGVNTFIPAPSAPPSSRSDTISPASTVYAVRFLTGGIPPSRILEESIDDRTEAEINASRDKTDTSSLEPNRSQDGQPITQHIRSETGEPTASLGPDHGNRSRWTHGLNPFKRRRSSPPAELARARRASGNARQGSFERSTNVRTRVSAFASSQKDRLTRCKGTDTAVPLDITIIPAQRRGRRTRSPEEAENAGDVEKTTQGRDEANAIPSASLHDVLSVVVIPPPRRGQRTWSPQEQDAGEPSTGDSRHLEPMEHFRAPGSSVPEIRSAEGGSPIQALSTQDSLRASEQQPRSPSFEGRASGDARSSPHLRLSASSTGSISPSPTLRMMVRLNPLQELAERQTVPEPEPGAARNIDDVRVQAEMPTRRASIESDDPTSR